MCFFVQVRAFRERHEERVREGLRAPGAGRAVLEPAGAVPVHGPLRQVGGGAGRLPRREQALRRHRQGHALLQVRGRLGLVPGHTVAHHLRPPRPEQGGHYPSQPRLVRVIIYLTDFTSPSHSHPPRPYSHTISFHTYPRAGGVHRLPRERGRAAARGPGLPSPRVPQARRGRHTQGRRTTDGTNTPSHSPTHHFLIILFI